MESKDDDERFMARALLLAAKGEGKVSPNPLVGAVLVKAGRIVGEGYHEFFGGPHAEVNAISDAEGKGNPIRGATFYVSLEPCSHSGAGKKTPPCVPLIIKKGIKRVVIAAEDANPEVKGIEQLKSAGIKITNGVLKKEAEQQNEAFLKHISTGKPFVVLKMAQSANGKMGIRGKANVRISGKQFDALVQRLRNRHDAILVGINTILADNPRLTCRMKGGRNPVRIIMDSQLRTPLNAKVLKNAHEERVIIACSQGAGIKKEDRLFSERKVVPFSLREKEVALKEKGAQVLICGKKGADLGALIESLPSLGIYSLLIEGGAQIAKSALQERLLDKAIVCISPKKIGATGAVSSPITARVLKRLKNAERKKMGEDTVVEGYP